MVVSYLPVTPGRRGPADCLPNMWVEPPLPHLPPEPLVRLPVEPSVSDFCGPACCLPNILVVPALANAGVLLLITLPLAISLFLSCCHTLSRAFNPARL